MAKQFPEPLVTEADYDAALDHVDTLMDAEPDSPEEEELGNLVALIVAYEHKHYPMGE